MKIGIFYLNNGAIKETANELASFLRKRGVEVLFGPDILDSKDSEKTIIMSLGGDGRVIRAAHIGLKIDVHVIGVNLGNLGFLTDVEARDLFDAAEEVLKGIFFIEKRMTLKMTYFSEKSDEKEFVAINDFVIQRDIKGEILSTEIFVNGMNSGNFRSDGMVISTPTGSTAYSLSLGGPIISPLSDVYLLTFIAPHKLTARPVVFSNKDRVSVRIDSDNLLYLLRDGEEILHLKKFDRLLFRKNENYLKILHLKNKNFFDVLNKKFGWGYG